MGNDENYRDLDADLSSCFSMERDRDKIPSELGLRWASIMTSCDEVRRQAISRAHNLGDTAREIYYRGLNL